MINPWLSYTCYGDSWINHLICCVLTIHVSQLYLVGIIRDDFFQDLSSWMRGADAMSPEAAVDR